jgi:hexosaminidase
MQSSKKTFLGKYLIILWCVLSVQCLFGQYINKTANFPINGFHLDLRIQVMKVSALKELAVRLSKNGVNTLIMEYEATFPYNSNPLIANRYAYSKEEIADFVKFCTGLGIDVIPLQQTFGHVEYILRNNRYTELREDQKDLSQVCPSKDGLNKALFTELFTEMVALHPSKYVHIGGDETHLLGHCPICKAKVAQEGVAKLYADHIKLMCDIVIKLGKIPVMWADIALKYPDALQYLPKGIVFVDWNYGWDLNKFGNHEKLMQSGFEIWGAVSLRSSPDNYNLTLWQKHFDNLRDFIPAARNLGYKGMILTSWSTSGVYSPIGESGYDLLDLIPVRRVYPLAGFNMLIDAFAESMRHEQPINTEKFIVDYCAKNYGFTNNQAIAFWNALKAAPYEMGNGKVKGPISLKQLLDSTTLASKTIFSLVPTKNQLEYEQYKLMVNIRLQYLKYQALEEQVNNYNFRADKIPPIAKQLKEVIDTVKNINKKFIEVNKRNYYTSELELENELHIEKMQLLYDRLARNK